MKPIVHDVGNLFDDRNLFLQVSLGLVAFSERFRHLVVRYGNHPPKRTRSGSRRRAVDPVDPVVDLLLGIAAFSERGREVLGRVRAEAEPSTRPRPRRRRNGAPLTLRGLLE